jgi:hypothetical protein
MWRVRGGEVACGAAMTPPTWLFGHLPGCYSLFIGCKQTRCAEKRDRWWLENVIVPSVRRQLWP